MTRSKQSRVHSVSYAKLTPPRLPKVVERTRLYRLLDRARHRPAVWITAPPGYGKTTLVASYLKARKLKTLWYQVDDGDADVATFFHYMGLAVQQASPRFRTPLPKLTPEYLPGLTVFSRRFFEQVYGRIGGRSVLVLDNYQEIPVDSTLHELVAIAMSQVPVGVSIVVVSRQPPPSTFCSVQAERRLSLIDHRALQLTTKEAEAVVRLQMNRSVGKPVRSIVKQVDGWVTGLVLLLEQGEAGQPTTESFKRRPPAVLFDYLAREVLQRLPAEEQAFLVQSALLPKMTVGMAEQLTGYKLGGAVLARLARAHYFTEQRFEQEPMFEYHTLFREFLQAQAVKTFAPSELVRLQNKAGAILEEAGCLEDAVALYRAAGQHGELGRLILTQAPALAEQGRLQLIESWIKILPLNVIDTTPWLLFWLGSCRMPFNPVESLPHFERAFSAFERQGDQGGTLLAWCGAVQSIWFAWKDLAQLDRWIDRLSTVQPPDVPYPSPQIEAQVASSMIHALMMRRPDTAWLDPWVHRGLELLYREGALNDHLPLGNVMIQYFVVWKAEFDAGGLVLSILSERLRTGNASPFAKSAFHLGRATYLWQTGRIYEALEDIETGLSICESNGAFLYLSSFLGYGVYVALAAGQSHRAELFFARFEALMARSETVLLRGFFYSLAGWRALMQGRLHDAWRHVQAGLESAEKHEGLFARIQQTIAAAQVCHELGRTKEARRFIAESNAYSKVLPDGFYHWPLDLTDALVEWESGDRTKALRSLGNAMQFGKMRRMFDTMWWRPDMMAKLCALALEHDIEPDYVRGLIAARALIPPANGIATDAWPWPIKIRTLGTFTIERDGKPVEFGRKTPKKPLELLKAIIALGGVAVPETTLADRLWPDAEGDVAHETFAKTLHRLRHLLGHEEALRRRDGKVSLDLQLCWVDVLAFEYLIRSAPSAKANAPQKDWVFAYQKAVTLYRGPFLHKEDLAAWEEQRRQQLTRQYCRAITRLMDHYKQRNQREQLDRCFALVADAEPELIASLST